MLFSSPVFVFLFLPIVFLVNLKLPHKLSNFWLLIASLLFYAWGEPIYILLMIVSSIINFFLAKFIAKRNHSTFWLWMTIIFNIGLLGIFKYSNFVIDSINQLLALNIHFVEISLPIGISFYTFQTMSYVIDVYQHKTQVQHNYFDLLLYITFFPQLIAGPIVKYRDVADEIESRSITIDGMVSGFQRFILGLSKKLLLANTMAVAVDQIYSFNQGDVTTVIAWIGAISYCLQIYFDFSGYSDMAIGLGEIFGFHFKENFNYPYSANSIQDFWRRWHISLSSWFKEYVYIPLGGSRKGLSRGVINRLIVFFLTGLWHGAAWTFVIWGLYNGLFLLLEMTILKVNKWPKPLQHLYTLLVVLIGFIIFRAESLHQAIHFITQLFSFTPTTLIASGWIQVNVDIRFIFIGIVCIVLSSPIVYKRFQKTPPLLHYALSVGLWILCLLTLSAATYNPFIYFRF